METDCVIDELDRLRASLSKYGKSGLDRIHGLIHILKSWECDFPANHVSQDTLKLLRSIVIEEVRGMNCSMPETVADQVVLVMVGALQAERSLNQSDPWDIAKKSVNVILNNSTSNEKLPSKFIFMSLVLALIAFGFIGYQQSKQKQEVILHAKPELPSLPSPLPSPYVPSHFYTMKKNMDKAVCQLPQAAMLPPDQRSAFLSFVNKGQISLAEISVLQEALSKVDCQYRPLTVSNNMYE